MTCRRALHFVFKIGQRSESVRFYKDVLGMKILRHEEFEEGCKAACNGPYDGKWSKTMIGFGKEDDHFVLELTYNYGIGSYQHGNDFQGITITSHEVCKQVQSSGWPVTVINGQSSVYDPDGYLFVLEELPSDGRPLTKLSLASSDLQKTLGFWCNLCGMELQMKHDDDHVTLAYDQQQVLLEFVDVHKTVDHGSAYGRVALSCPRSQLPEIQQMATDCGYRILTPLVDLDTPGKATVQVIILADPDGHEVCFVGDEAFRQLSQVDPEADSLLAAAMAADKSDEWFAKKGVTKSILTSTT
jgi:lactoylglutathione lyase